MKITTLQLLTLADSNALDELSNQKLTPVAAYRLSRVAAVLTPETQRIQQARNALLTKENSIPLDGGLVQLKPEHTQAFLHALQPLLQETLDLEVKPLKLDDLNGATITANHIAALGPLLEE